MYMYIYISDVCIIYLLQFAGAGATFVFMPASVSVVEGQVAQVCVALANVQAGQSLGCPVTVTLVLNDGSNASMFSHDSSVNSVYVMCIALNNNIAVVLYLIFLYVSY